jgi:WD40 repeat-containing protein SMU1
MRYLKEDYPDRYLKLEYLCKLPTFNSIDVYEVGSSKEKKRLEISESIISEILHVPQNRLLSIIGQAMKYQNSIGLLPKGMPFDIFKGKFLQILYLVVF